MGAEGGLLRDHSEVLGIVGRNGLDSSDPLKRGQGYLLLTVGYHADTLTVSTA